MVDGLDIGPEDTVLTLGAAGDQAFAFLEVAKQVKYIDRDIRNVDALQERVYSLKEGNYDYFLNLEPAQRSDVFVDRRNKYFERKGRLDTISQRLDRLEILGVGDIINDVSATEDFNKLYVSNALDCLNNWDDSRNEQVLELISYSLPKDGLVYITGDITGSSSHDWVSRAPPGLRLDKRLTKKACKLEKFVDFWWPRVFRKMY